MLCGLPYDPEDRASHSHGDHDVDQDRHPPFFVRIAIKQREAGGEGKNLEHEEPRLIRIGADRIHRSNSRQRRIATQAQHNRLERRESGKHEHR